jgi:hypothetical protein
MRNNSEYLVTMDRHCDIVTVKDNDSDKSFTFHLSTNYPEYSLVPSNIYWSNDYEKKMIVKRNDLPNNWIRGNFNFFTNEGEKIRRVTQYEYDKACYEGKFQTRTSDNALFYKYVTDRLAQLKPT